MVLRRGESEIQSGRMRRVCLRKKDIRGKMSEGAVRGVGQMFGAGKCPDSSGCQRGVSEVLVCGGEYSGMSAGKDLRSRAPRGWNRGTNVQGGRMSTIRPANVGGRPAEDE